MSDSAVVTPPTVIPKTVTLDSELVIETLAAMNAVGSLLSFLDDGGAGVAGSEAAEWIHGHAAKLEETSFNTEGVMHEDDDPLVVAVQARSDELAAQVMSYYDELLPKASEYFRSARKIRESGTT
jgi:hypothetical protein